MSTGPNVIPRWLPTTLYVAWALAGLVFALLWHRDARALRAERRSYGAAFERLNQVCRTTTSGFEQLSRDLKRAPSDRLVERGSYESDFRAGIAGSCMRPDRPPSPLDPGLVWMRDLGDASVLRHSAAELITWADWYAEALRSSEADDWSRRAWEEVSRGRRGRGPPASSPAGRN